MNIIARLFFLLCLTVSAAGAQSATGDAEKLLTRFAEALYQKDADAIARIVRPEAEVHILWLDSTPAKRFTLTGAHYVQQLRALWKFTREDRHEFGPVQWGKGTDGRLTARLQHRETRLLQGVESGQEDKLELAFAEVDGTLHVTRINTSTHMW